MATISSVCRFASDLELMRAYTLDARIAGVRELAPQAPIYVAA
jgi:hypothetical protein